MITELVILTGAINAKQKRDVTSHDVPNAFVQTDVPKKQGLPRIIMKI